MNRDWKYLRSNEATMHEVEEVVWLVVLLIAAAVIAG